MVKSFLNNVSQLELSLAREFPAKSNVNNHNIKSPFATYNDEMHKLILPQRRTSFDEVDFLLETGYIGSVEDAIINILNKMLFATSIQIHQMLNIAGADIDINKIRQSLKKLKSKSFVKQIEFCSKSDENLKSSFKAYTLGYHGVGLLKARGIKAHMQGYIKEMPTANIKMVLATNQLIISILERIEGSFTSMLCVWDELNSSVNIVRPMAVLRVGEDTYFINCTRVTENWQEDLSERLVRYNKVIQNYETLNIKVSKAPVMIFLCEDYENMRDVARLTTDYTELEKIFTYDTAVYTDTEKPFYCI